jgi:hypothetical protein
MARREGQGGRVSEAALTAAKASGFVIHSERCRFSKLASCICLYDARLEHLARAFEKFAAEQVEALERSGKRDG